MYKCPSALVQFALIKMVHKFCLLDKIGKFQTVTLPWQSCVENQGKGGVDVGQERLKEGGIAGEGSEEAHGDRVRRLKK